MPYHALHQFARCKSGVAAMISTRDGKTLTTDPRKNRHHHRHGLVKDQRFATAQSRYSESPQGFEDCRSDHYHVGLSSRSHNCFQELTSSALGNVASEMAGQSVLQTNSPANRVTAALNSANKSKAVSCASRGVASEVCS